MASMGPSLVLPAPDARPLMAARAASIASSGSDLPFIAPGLPVGSVDFYDLDALPPQEPGEPDPIGAGALDADFVHLAEALEPGQQRLVAGRVGTEGLGSDQSSQRIQCRGHVVVQVGIDTARDPGSSFYDGHGHPFLP